jgi:plastocyanin
MSLHRRWPALAGVLAALSLATAASAEDADHIAHEHRLVRIGSVSLHPTTLAIGPGDAFGWLNYSDQIASVSFPASVGAKLLCKQKTSFRLSGDRLVSGDVQARQFASLCSLAPGEYPYQVMLRTGLGGSGAAPGRTLAGTLVVR